MRKVYAIGAIALMFAACRPSVSITTPPSPGPTLNFNNFLVVGDDYSGGFSDNSLTVRGQLNSYPQILFEQFSKIPDPRGAKGPFIMPWLESDNGYPGPKKVLGYWVNSCDHTDSMLAPIDYPNFLMHANDDLPYLSGVNNNQVNNISVMGIRMADYPVANYANLVEASYGLPYARRFYFDLAATPHAELKHRVDVLFPTVFTMWLGINDVLGYALYGGQGDGTGNALEQSGKFFNPRDITRIGAFDSAYRAALNEVSRTGANGALINVPDITLLPFFNVIKSNGLIVPTHTLADSLRIYWGGFGITAEFDTGIANQFMIRDHNGHVRQSVPGELILMTCPLDSIKCAGWGTTFPIPDTFVLTTDEIQFIRTATDRYNYTIRQEALLHHLAYVDMNAYFKTLPAGSPFNGISYSNEFIYGGFFSLDGLRPTQRGNALIANEIIKAMNHFYGSTVNTVDANKYRGVDFP
ncbi:MAG: hypothetical protein K0Q79_1929 [Flavipsychrobacter sp.]|jgi:hypothetical protein|nr:hypothetical protein [Flavipsychrobacter sp.]